MAAYRVGESVEFKDRSERFHRVLITDVDQRRYSLKFMEKKVPDRKLLYVDGVQESSLRPLYLVEEGDDEQLQPGRTINYWVQSSWKLGVLNCKGKAGEYYVDDAERKDPVYVSKKQNLRIHKNFQDGVWIIQ